MIPIWGGKGDLARFLRAHPPVLCIFLIWICIRICNQGKGLKLCESGAALAIITLLSKVPLLQSFNWVLPS